MNRQRFVTVDAASVVTVDEVMGVDQRPVSGEAGLAPCWIHPLSANSAFSSSRCRPDTHKELLNRPIKKKTEKKTDIPTSFPVRFTFLLVAGSVLTKPRIPLQPVPVQMHDDLVSGTRAGPAQLLGRRAWPLGTCLLHGHRQPVFVRVWPLSLCLRWTWASQGPRGGHLHWLAGSLLLHPVLSPSQGGWWPWASPPVGLRALGHQRHVPWTRGRNDNQETCRASAALWGDLQ